MVTRQAEDQGMKLAVSNDMKIPSGFKSDLVDVARDTGRCLDIWSLTETVTS